MGNERNTELLRSQSEKGEIIGIYLLGPATEEFCDSYIGACGQTAVCGAVGDDFANTVWPVVVKVKAEVTQAELSQYLRDLADAVDQGFFINPSHEKEFSPESKEVILSWGSFFTPNFSKRSLV
jgi:hypothetical protein